MSSIDASVRSRLALAVDCADLDAAHELVGAVADCIGYAKIGLELFVRAGPQALEVAHRHGLKSFLDLKLCDIPVTVERAVASACAFGVNLLTVHASGGGAMIEAAANRVRREGVDLRLIAVTVLTSLDASDLLRLGVTATPEQHTLALGKLALKAGASGLVCSPNEVARLRAEFGPDPMLVTPGIRAAGAEVGDQKRTASAATAITAGASLLVVGRPIRDAVDRKAAALALCSEIQSASQH